MISKTILMLSLFVLPMIIINSGLIASAGILFILYLISGLGMAGIGMGIMHDAIHGSYSTNKHVNKYLGYTMNLIGANSVVWRIQHNVLHHTYTNIDESDDDISPPSVLRFSPHAKKNWMHQFQHFYVWFFYALSTISWITSKDFVRINRYRKKGFFSKKNEFKTELAKLIGWKIFYYTYALILPILIVPLAPWIIVLAFLSMHFMTGILISIVFQVAHITPSVAFPLPDGDGIVEGDWFTHQLETTCNFSPKSEFFSWLIGGLNYQIEHHLLPNICHIHYKNISNIVELTAKEFGMPYHTKSTLSGAISDHIKMLRELGRVSPLTATVLRN